MPLYTALNTQIEAVKTEITASLAASTYTAQDLVYVAKTIETLGNLLGINDLAAASIQAQNDLNDFLATVLDGTNPLNVAKMYVGDGAQDFESEAGLSDPAIIASIESTNYAQIAFQNMGSGAASSTDYIAYGDNGVDSSGYIDMGFTSQNFSDPSFTITGASDGYIFVTGPEVLTAVVITKARTSNVATLTTSAAHNFRVGMPLTITGVDGSFNTASATIINIPSPSTFTYTSTGGDLAPASVSPNGAASAGKLGRGNLVLATGDTGSQNKIIFAAGGLGDNNTQMVIDPDTSVSINISTASTSPSTGALVVAGGLGVTGAVNIGGNVNIAGTISFSGGGTTVQTANIAVVNPAVFVADTNAANLLDFTFAGGYISSGQKYSAFTKKATDGIWNLVSGLTVKPGNTVDYTSAVYDTLKVGGIINTGTEALTGNLTINTNKFVVTAATGNTTVAGTLGVTGVITATAGITISATPAADTDATTVGFAYSQISGVWSTKTANYNLAARDAIFANTTGGAFTLTLPVTPAVNDRIRIADLAGTWGTTPAVLARNGNKIMGLSEDYSLNVRNASIELLYSGSTYGWRFV